MSQVRTPSGKYKKDDRGLSGVGDIRVAYSVDDSCTLVMLVDVCYLKE